jgi:hypothetical protein
MKTTRILLTGAAALGVFGLGYLAGQSAKTDNTPTTTASSSSTTRQAGHTNDPSSPDTRTATKPKPRNTNTDSPNPEKGFTHRIIDMMGKGELIVAGVDIDAFSLEPGQKVKEFLNLTDEQIQAMTQMGRDRLRAKQEHEETMATIQKSTDREFIFDVAADPAFAAREKEAYREDISKAFGSDVAAVLQHSIDHAYIDFEHPRHVSITATPDKGDPNMTYVTVGVNRNEDGSFMKDELGRTLPNAHGLEGAIYRDKPDATFSRYYSLWQEKKQR